MTEKEKLEDHKGSGTHWQQKNPQIHFKFALNGADCSLILNTEMQHVETKSWYTTFIRNPSSQLTSPRLNKTLSPGLTVVSIDHS